MSAILDFHDPIRVIMGDRDSDPDFRMFEADAISSGIRLTVNAGRLPGYSMADTNNITPDIAVPSSSYGLLCYRTALAFAAPNPSNYSVRTRAFSERFGNWNVFMAHLESEIYQIEMNGGAPISVWQTWDTFSKGSQGLPTTAFLQELEFSGTNSTLSYP